MIYLVWFESFPLNQFLRLLIAIISQWSFPDSFSESNLTYKQYQLLWCQFCLYCPLSIVNPSLTYRQISVIMIPILLVLQVIVHCPGIVFLFIQRNFISSVAMKHDATYLYSLHLSIDRKIILRHWNLFFFWWKMTSERKGWFLTTVCEDTQPDILKTLAKNTRKRISLTLIFILHTYLTLNKTSTKL